MLVIIIIARPAVVSALLLAEMAHSQSSAVDDSGSLSNTLLFVCMQSSCGAAAVPLLCYVDAVVAALAPGPFNGWQLTNRICCFTPLIQG